MFSNLQTVAIPIFSYDCEEINDIQLENQA